MEKSDIIKTIGEIALRSPMTIFQWSAENGWPVLTVSDNVEELTGYKAEEFLNGSVVYEELIYRGDITRVRHEVSYYSAHPEYKKFAHEPYRITHKDGHQLWIEDHTNIIRDKNGKIINYEGIVYDCTPRMTAEHALKENERYVRDIEALSGVASGEYEPNIDHFFSSPNLPYLLNTEEKDQNQDLTTIEYSIHSDDKNRVHLQHEMFRKAPVPYSILYRIIARDGEIRYIRETVKLEVDDAREFRCLFTFSDDTDEQNYRSQIEQNERECRTCFQNEPIPLWREDATPLFKRFQELGDSGVQDLNEYIEANIDQVYELLNLLVIEDVNSATLELFGVDNKEYLDQHINEFLSEESITGIKEILKALAQGEMKYSTVTEIVRSDGEVRQVLMSCFVLDESSELQNEKKKILISTVDISEQVKSEELLNMLQTAVEQSPVSIVITDERGRIEYVNPCFTEITGYTMDEVVGQNSRIFKSGKHKDSVYKELWETILNGEEWHGVLQNRIKDGSLIYEEMAIAPICNSKGEIYRFVAVKEDITEKHMLEEQFFQSQKMESIGRLASGIAHDFNNILTVISGCAEYLHYEFGEESEFFDDIKEIENASERGGHLTKQLLAFSRKEVVKPDLVKVNDLIESMTKMMRRMIPENITLNINVGPKDTTLFADSGQIEQVLMNLVINCSNAIGRDSAGTISIESTSRVIDTAFHSHGITLHPGTYFVLAISDTGCGMTDEVKERIFEPFFTTRDIGEGSGLGMSTVYGILHQNNASITIESEVGKGSHFEIMWPQVHNKARKKEDRTGKPLRGSETILFVEDEENLCSVVSQRLMDLGYTVIPVNDGRDAINVIRERSSEIDVVLTDMVMPNVGGVELGIFIKENYESIPVIYCSGYVDTTVPSILQHQYEENFIQKPYSLLTLTQKMRSLWD